MPEDRIEPPFMSPKLRALVLAACRWRSEWSELADLDLADAIDAWTADVAESAGMLPHLDT